MKRLKNKKGFTLVEVIVAMGITTIIMVAAANLFTPAMQIITSTRNNENLDVVCDTVNTYVRNKIDTATDAVIVSDSDMDTSINEFKNATDNAKYRVKVISVTGGQLYDYGVVYNPATGVNVGSSELTYNRNKYRVYNSDFYSNSSLHVGFEGKTQTVGSDKYALWLKMTTKCIASDGNDANQAKTITFKMLGGKAKLNITGDTISTDDASLGMSNNFVIVYREVILP